MWRNVTYECAYLTVEGLIVPIDPHEDCYNCGLQLLKSNTQQNCPSPPMSIEVRFDGECMFILLL